jgi:hypothetical protein
MFDSGGLGDAGARARSAPAITATADAGAPSRAGARCASRALPVIELAFARLLTRAIALDLDTWPRHASTHGHGSTNDAVHSPAEAAGLTRADSATAADAVAAADRPAATDSRTAAEGPTATDGPAATEGSAGGDALVLGKAAALVGSDLAHASDDDLVDAVVAWQHVASWAAAAQARLVGELLARGGSSSRAADAVVHELSAALVTSRRTAAALVGRATGLGAVPQVADALADGRIDCARADVLTSYENVPVAVRDRVAVQLVGTRSDPGPATGLTPAQLRDRLRRAAIETNPEDAVKRAEAAAGGRHVWIDPAPDQMAWLTALLPAADAARAWARIDGAARTVVRTPGDTRTLAQARADALTDLLAGSVPLDTALPTSTNAADPHGARPPAGDPSVRSAVRTVVNVTIAASTLLGIDESPADLGGYGPIPAPLARGLATDPDATWRRILTDPATGIATDVSRTAYRPGLVLGDLVRTTHAMCTFPGCRVPAARCDLDHIDPFDAGRQPPPRVPRPPQRQDPRRVGHSSRARRRHHLDRSLRARLHGRGSGDRSHRPRPATDPAATDPAVTTVTAVTGSHEGGPEQSPARSIGRGRRPRRRMRIRSGPIRQRPVVSRAIGSRAIGPGPGPRRRQRREQLRPTVLTAATQAAATQAAATQPR